MKKHILFMLLLASSMALGMPTIVHAETTEDAAKEQAGTDFEVSTQSEDIGTVSSLSDQSAGQSKESENGSQTEKAALEDSDNETNSATVIEPNGKQNESTDNGSKQSDPHIEQNGENKDVPVLDSSNAMEETGNEVISTSTEESEKKQDESVNSESELLAQDSEEDNENTETTQAKASNALDNSDSEDKNGYATDKNGAVYNKTGWFEETDQYGNTYWYFGNEDGSLKTGLIEENGQKYYLNPYLMVGFFSIYDDASHESKYYATNKNGAVCNKTGWFEETDQYGNTYWYYGNDDGSLKTGWFEENGQKYYLNPTLQVRTFGVYDDTTSEYKYYLADKYGHVYFKNGWIEDTDQYGNTSWYYGNDDGSLYTGWLTIDNKKYYFMWDGSCACDTGNGTGVYEIDGKSYHFEANGALDTGWYRSSDKSYGGSCWAYSKEDGTVVKRAWIQSGSDWYYLDEDGVALTNTTAYEMKTDSGETYLVNYPDSNYMTGRMYSFDKEGRMLNKAGWQKIENTYYDGNGNETYTNWYYLNTDGTLYNEKWLLDNGNWYYFQDGIMVSDRISDIGDETYIFDENGHMLADGWKKLYNFWYYLNKNGTGYNGWLNGTYYIDQGKMLTSCYTPDGYFVDANGCWDKTVPQLTGNGGWKIEYGTPINDTTGWIMANDRRYYVDPESHQIVTGLHEIDGTTNGFNQAGIWIGNVEDGWYKDCYDQWHMVKNQKILKDQWYGDYYLNSFGSMSVDSFVALCRDQDGTQYYTDMYSDGEILAAYGVDQNGKWIKGWSKIEAGLWSYDVDRWRYFDPQNGIALPGWRMVDGRWYFFDDYGFMKTGLISDAQDRCYFIEADGTTLKTGWLQFGNEGDWYYFDSNGEGHNGILNYNGKQYCFEKGKMIRNGYYDGDWYNMDGVKTVLH